MKEILVGTRTSPLALWQAHAVQQSLSLKGFESRCAGIESTGDIDLTTPLYTMGITGIFTKELDIALLEKRIDIAVHSLKDVPTILAKGITLCAVLPRGSALDVVVCKADTDLQTEGLKIATSSVRRKAQWLARYPSHQVFPVRGNIQTRLRKLHGQEDLAGMIFAQAALERLGLSNENTIRLDWMLPAPAQGIIGILCRADDEEIISACAKINHTNSYLAAVIERNFMNTLQGGCAIPVSCHATVENDRINFKGAIHSVDGKKSFWIEKNISSSQSVHLGADAAMELLATEGASLLMDEIRRSL